MKEKMSLPTISPMLRSLLEQRQDIEMVMRSMQGMHSKNESRIYDEIHFSGYPLYKSVTFHPCWGEYFDVDMDPNHFEFFESTEDIKCFSGDNQ
jgi:hypothetical protein